MFISNAHFAVGDGGGKQFSSLINSGFRDEPAYPETENLYLFFVNK